MLRRERRSTVAGDTEYAFRHVLMRDVAYGQIPRAQRADKHQTARRRGSSRSRPTATTAPDMLAHHYARALEYARDAGQPTEELELRTRLALRDAGDRARSLSSLTSAQHYYVAALALWPKDDPDWPELVLSDRRRRVRPDRRGHDRAAERGARTVPGVRGSRERRQGRDAARIPLLERGPSRRGRGRVRDRACPDRARRSRPRRSRTSPAGWRSSRCCAGSSTTPSRSVGSPWRSPRSSTWRTSAATS